MSDFIGTDGEDTLVGGQGADVINGGGGRDRINGADGSDTIYGGDERDYIWGDRGSDLLFGEAGDDALVGHSGNDTIYGGFGADGMFGGGDSDELHGDDGNDTIYGDGGHDLILGGAGNDQLFGGSGNDVFVQIAGEGQDTIVGNTGMDTLRVYMTLAEFEAARAALVEFADWVAAVANTSANNDGETYSLSELGLTVSAIENFEMFVDGEAMALDEARNYAPVADPNQSVSGNEDSSIFGNVGATDPDGDPLDHDVATGPSNGSVIVNTSTGAFEYTPNTNFSGSDSFEISIVDNAGNGTSQQVDVTVGAVADAPTLSASATNVSSGGSGDMIVGTSGSDFLVGTGGSDHISAGDGHDVITADPHLGTLLGAVDDLLGDGGDGDQGVVVSLAIDAALTDLDGSETLSIKIEGIPTDASLSAGTVDSEGVWHLTPGQLTGLQLTSPQAVSTDLTITATATESAGDTASTSIVVTVDAAPSNGQPGFDMISIPVDDVLLGGQGNDTIDGGEGFDILDASQATQSLQVGLGWNSMNGEGNDVLYGIEGVVGSSYSDQMYGTDGANFFDVGGGDDQVYAFDGNDTVLGGAGNDQIYGYEGDDLIEGGDGRDQLYGMDDNDTLVGGAGDDQLHGDRGNDVIYDGAGDDEAYGGDGDDVIVAGGGNDEFGGNSGFDTLDLSNIEGGVSLDIRAGRGSTQGGERIEFSDFESYILTGGDDQASAVRARGAVSISGGDGNDVLTGHAGLDDTLSGDGGDDDLLGGGGDDLLSGGTGNDRLYGATGDDTLDGGEGDDVLNSGLGADVLTGGEGADSFTYYSYDIVSSNYRGNRWSYDHEGVDTITDFGVGDRLEFWEGASTGTSRWGADIADVIRTEATAGGTLVSYNHEGYGWADAVLLQGVDVSLQDLIDGGQIDFGQFAI